VFSDPAQHLASPWQGRGYGYHVIQESSVESSQSSLAANTHSQEAGPGEYVISHRLRTLGFHYNTQAVGLTAYLGGWSSNHHAFALSSLLLQLLHGATSDPLPLHGLLFGCLPARYLGRVSQDNLIHDCSLFSSLQSSSIKTTLKMVPDYSSQ
jgi:hypothetical protein